MGSLQQGKSLVVLNQQKRIEQNLLSVQAKVLFKQAGTLSSSAVATHEITILFLSKTHSSLYLCFLSFQLELFYCNQTVNTMVYLSESSYSLFYQWKLGLTLRTLRASIRNMDTHIFFISLLQLIWFSLHTLSYWLYLYSSRSLSLSLHNPWHL